MRPVVTFRLPVASLVLPSTGTFLGSTRNTAESLNTRSQQNKASIYRIQKVASELLCLPAVPGNDVYNGSWRSQGLDCEQCRTVL